jgi:soluble lytic murein transglycosylase-like protein
VKQFLVARDPVTINYNDRWDSLIQFYAERWSGEWQDSDKNSQRVIVPWRLIKSQIKQESNFNPLAVSHVGAAGLLQLMPKTDYEIDLEVDGWNPDGNLDDGVKYLVLQYIHFPEITTGIQEKWKFALASFNGGRGYVNKALQLARDSSFKKWQIWDEVKDFLKSPECVVNGMRPDHKQITEYVDRIWSNFTKG